MAGIQGLASTLLVPPVLKTLPVCPKATVSLHPRLFLVTWFFDVGAGRLARNWIRRRVVHRVGSEHRQVGIQSKTGIRRGLQIRCTRRRTGLFLLWLVRAATICRGEAVFNPASAYQDITINSNLLDPVFRVVLSGNLVLPQKYLLNISRPRMTKPID